MNIHIVGVPSDLGASCRGSDMGPRAIRDVRLHPRRDDNLIQELHNLGHIVTDEGDLPAGQREIPPYRNPQLKNLEPIVDVCETLSSVVERICRAGGFPLVLGGDHSIALGTITGVARVYAPIGVMWIDAHGDFNTDQITPSGNIHGMPLAALAGFGHERLVKLGGFTPKIAPTRIAIVGARDLDAEERKLLAQAGVHVYTMKDIDREGISKIISHGLDTITSDTNGLHVSFDLDVLDPDKAPGVGTRVSGGLSYREARHAMELIADSGKLRSLEMVEVNPTLDQENRTARLSVELMLTALGKTLF